MAPTNPSAFLNQLPAEIRNLTYDHALSEAKPINIFTARSPALARTCGQIHRESLGIFYSSNVFIATIYESIDSCFNEIKDWLTNVVGENCRHLRKIRLVIGAPEGLQAVALYREGQKPWAWLERTLTELG